MYSGHAGKKELDVSDVRLAVQTRVDHSFTTPPPRDVNTTYSTCTFYTTHVHVDVHVLYIHVRVHVNSTCACMYTCTVHTRMYSSYMAITLNVNVHIFTNPGSHDMKYCALLSFLIHFTFSF